MSPPRPSDRGAPNAWSDRRGKGGRPGSPSVTRKFNFNTCYDCQRANRPFNHDFTKCEHSINRRAAKWAEMNPEEAAARAGRRGGQYVPPTAGKDVASSSTAVNTPPLPRLHTKSREVRVQGEQALLMPDSSRHHPLLRNGGTLVRECRKLPSPKCSLVRERRWRRGGGF